MTADAGRSRLRRLASDYEAGAISRDAYRKRRRELIESFTAALDNSLETTVSLGPGTALGPGSDPFGNAAPGTQPQGADLTLALSARPPTEFRARGATGAGGVGVENPGAESAERKAPPTRSSRRKGISRALLAAMALVVSAALLGVMLSGVLGG